MGPGRNRGRPCSRARQEAPEEALPDPGPSRCSGWTCKPLDTSLCGLYISQGAAPRSAPLGESPGPGRPDPPALPHQLSLLSSNPAFMPSPDLSALTVAQIHSWLRTLPSVDDTLIACLEADPRRGVQRLASSVRRRRRAEGAERNRLERMHALERRLHRRGLRRIAGVDEAGRGPLAGPVVAAAVIFPPKRIFWESTTPRSSLRNAARNSISAFVKSLRMYPSPRRTRGKSTGTTSSRPRSWRCGGP